MKLGILMIVKNESSCLERCLESVKDADAIFIADTGSEDNTIEIAKKYTDKIYNYEWNDHFADARNFVLEKAKTSDMDYFLSIDADEVLETPLQELKDFLATSQLKTYQIDMVSTQDRRLWHHPVRVFKNLPEVHWNGRAHEAIHPVETNKCPGVIAYGRSENHDKDPDRMLRILKKAVEENPNSPRDLFYLAREYATRKEYEKCIFYASQCIKHSQWEAEKAHAYLLLARCYWQLQRGDEARQVGHKASQANPDLREAWLFLADAHYSPWKEKYLQMAELATNKNAIFIQCPKIVSQKIPKILHHLWVGPKPAPMEWINTWREKHPDWEHILWDNDKVFGRKWRNQRLIDEYKKQECWHGVADVARYEILYEMGGLHPGADTICKHNTEELWADGFELYAVYENEEVRPGLITPLYASVPGHWFVDELIKGLEKKEATEPWLTTGNKYMQEMVAGYMPPMMILPSYRFNPRHYTGVTYQGTGKVYAEQQWGTTHELSEKQNAIREQ